MMLFHVRDSTTTGLERKSLDITIELDLFSLRSSYGAGE